MNTQIAKALESAAQKIFDQKITVELTRPDEQFGDFSTNVALQLAGKVGKSPRQVAEQLVESVKPQLGDMVKDITIAGAGFINFALSDQALYQNAAEAVNVRPDMYKDKVVVAEYSDPNPFKVMHVGHLYTTVVGDAIANVLQASGGTVHRVNFGGDVGLHVAKSMWGIVQKIGGELPEKLDVAEKDRATWLSERYVEGNNAYEDDASAKEEIIAINKRVYDLHSAGDHDSPFAQIYWTCRQWSYDAFDAFYKRLNVTFEKYYPESQTTPVGLQTVKDQLAKGVYQESDGAVVFKGEAHDLHTRVFITSAGLPTYEAKDVGLIMSKWGDYKFDLSVIITGNDIVEYMKVVLKSIEQFMPDLAARSLHLTHGMIRMSGGVKMSSRKGNVLQASDILDAATEASKKANHQASDTTILAAVKYAFLKQRTGGDVIYDPEESVSMEGNSGPYLQYAHARARSILAKAKTKATEPKELQAGERSLARKISEYPDILQKATAELMPHHICTYLYELAQSFNRFYEKNRVVDDPRQAERLTLVGLYADVLKDGLSLLGIVAPDRL